MDSPSRARGRARAVRVALVLLALGGVPLAVWATFAPRSFYDDFPGAGRSWIAVDGPYNEHLVRDVGALQLALVVVTAVAAVTLVRTLVLATAAGWLAWSVPHLVYHVRTADRLDGTIDRIGALGGIALSVLLAAGVLALVLTGPRPATGVRPDGERSDRTVA